MILQKFEAYYEVSGRGPPAFSSYAEAKKAAEEFKKENFDLFPFGKMKTEVAQDYDGDWHWRFTHSIKSEQEFIKNVKTCSEGTMSSLPRPDEGPQ